MKYLIFILAFFTISCKAQTVSLETAAKCPLNPDSCPDFTYVKDLNNSLTQYVGTWKGSYNGKTYELKFNKSLYEDADMKRDDITGRLRITNSSGQVIYNTFTEANDTKTSFSGLNFQPNLKEYRVYFVGPATEGCINSGTVYLKIKPETPNQMNIFYWSDMDIVQGSCPASFTNTFPEQKTINLTKQ